MRLEPSNPGNIMLMSNLGIVQYNSGKDSLALVTLTQAHDIAPRSVTILGNRARVLMAMGRFEEARADYSAIVEADSTMTPASTAPCSTLRPATPPQPAPTSTGSDATTPTT